MDEMKAVPEGSAGAAAAPAPENDAPRLSHEELRAAVEAIIYVADEPATVRQMARALGAADLEVRAAIDELVAFYSTDERGVEIRKVAGGWRFNTKVQHHD